MGESHNKDRGEGKKVYGSTLKRYKPIARSTTPIARSSVPIARTSAPAKVSAKQAVINASWSVTREEFLEELRVRQGEVHTPHCEAQIEGCQWWVKEVHHKDGRGADKVLDKTRLLGLCVSCHHIIEVHPEMAKAHDFSGYRLFNISGENSNKNV